MHVTLFSPRIAVQKGDFLGSGVPYWPLELAVFAAFLRDMGEQVSVVDLFGTATDRLTDHGDHYLQGADWRQRETAPEITEADAFVLFALSYMSHGELLELARGLKAAWPDTPVLVMENSQAVTAYAPQRMAAGFFSAGADGILCGEPYFNWDEVAAWLRNLESTPAPGNVLPAREPEATVERRYLKDARYPAPAWDLFDLEGYWSLPYSHGPKTARYLPILTSRGCPWPCDFCVVPETNDRQWRMRPPEDVVDEMLEMRDRFGVRHFQVEDLNPTVRSDRWTAISQLLLEREAGIHFYFVSGTKAETVKLDQVPVLARAGCRYISISPESGSADLMKKIGKRFDYDHALELVKTCRGHGIRTQACFLVGHPAESETDHASSRTYLRQIVRAGVDEIAVFVVAPFAGSSLFDRGALALGDPAALPSFSPKGREGYAVCERRRKQLIRLFFLEKLKKGLDLWLQGLRAVFGRPQTKMENLPRRVAFVMGLILRYRLRTLFSGRA